MPVDFSSHTLWRDIRRIARDRGPRFVAVPFVGAGAARQLKLRRGDTLVTRFDQASVRAGVVHPQTIIKYLAAGVRVYRCDELHAKVYVSAVRAVVGSANLSTSSANTLDEAGVVAVRSSLVYAARQYVKNLADRSAFVGPELAKEMQKLYRPPRRPNHRRAAQGKRALVGPQFWVASMVHADFEPLAESAAESARESIRKRRDPKRYELSDFEVRDSVSVRRIKIGDELLQICRDTRRLEAEPIAVVVAVKPFRSSRGIGKRMLVLEHRKWARSRPIRAAQAAVGRDGPNLRRIALPRRLGQQAHVQSLRSLWAE